LFLIRKTTQKLKLASDASYIYERGTDEGRALDSLSRCVEFILASGGGSIACNIIDSRKQSDYKPRTLKVNSNKIDNILGINLSDTEKVCILKNLDLRPTISGNNMILNIPSYRKDLNIDEDIAEELARFYGYNNFPKTLPTGQSNTAKVPYIYDRDFELKLKNIFINLGFYEQNTQALTSESTLKKSLLNVDNHLRIKNPVSSENEFFRTSLIPNLLSAVKLNNAVNDLKLFEYNKVYFPPVNDAKEKYCLSAIIRNGSYRAIKGVLDTLLARLNIDKVIIKHTLVEKGLWSPQKSGVIEKGNHDIGTIGEINPLVIDNYQLDNDLLALELNVENLKILSKPQLFKVIPQYPAQVEDITLIIPENIKVGSVIQSIKETSEHIIKIELKDIYQRSYTFRIYYQDLKKTLTDNEVQSLRKEFLSILKKEFSITQS